MATVRLEFDLDSDVYPELYAVLSELRSVRARGERMRALASAGLVWENVRIHGAAAIGQTPPAEPVAAPARPAPPPKAERRAPARPRAVPVRPLPDPRGADFIDLAIDAEPEPEPEVTAAEVRDEILAKDDGPMRRESEAVVRNLPVLMDVVPDSDVISDAVEARPVAPLQVVPQSLPPSAAHAAHEPQRVHVSGGGDDGHGDDAIHLTALAQRPATRSRLMRMKDKGLFKNG